MKPNTKSAERLERNCLENKAPFHLTISGCFIISYIYIDRVNYFTDLLIKAVIRAFRREAVFFLIRPVLAALSKAL